MSGMCRVLFVIALICCASGARGQCEPQWLPGGGLPGVRGAVWSMAVLPGGDVVVGGEFTIAGDVQVSNIARWDGARWHALGDGINGIVRSLSVLPGGDVVAGGPFTHAGGIEVNAIARWDGEAWHSLGTGMAGGTLSRRGVYAQAVLSNGDLIAGGHFTIAGGVAANHIARWDGEVWHNIGGGFNESVVALTVMPGGDIVAGGLFSGAEGQLVRYIARWDGSNWSALGEGLSHVVRALAVLPSGDLIAGGQFISAYGGPAARHVARWDGSQWHAMDEGVAGMVRALAVLPDGSLVAGRHISGQHGVVGRWDGQQWTEVGYIAQPQPGTSAQPSALALALPGDGSLLVGGNFTRMRADLETAWTGAYSVTRWFGGLWEPMGADVTDGPVRRLWRLPDGEVLAEGDFETLQGFDAPRLAVSAEGQWEQLWQNEDVLIRAVAPLPDGSWVAAGDFDGDWVARWNGNTFEMLGSGIDNLVYALATYPDGRIVAGGLFSAAGGVITNRITMWNGSAWRPLGAGIVSATWSGTTVVYTLAILPGGEVVAGGRFIVAGTAEVHNVALWDGTEWSAMGSSVGAWNDLWVLKVLPGGQLVGGGRFDIVGGSVGVVQWDGVEWAPLGDGLSRTVHGLTLTNGGDLIAVGSFVAEVSGGETARNIARWDGSQWHALGAGLDSAAVAVVVRPDGTVVAGGNFMEAGGAVSPYLAMWGCADEPCYADCDENGELNVADFLCFIDGFALASTLPLQEQIAHYANCTGATVEPILSIADFLCFIDAFALGCP